MAGAADSRRWKHKLLASRRRHTRRPYAVETIVTKVLAAVPVASTALQFHTEFKAYAYQYQRFQTYHLITK